MKATQTQCKRKKLVKTSYNFNLYARNKAGPLKPKILGW